MELKPRRSTTITRILGRAGVNEFNQASLLYDTSANLAVGARLTF